MTRARTRRWAGVLAAVAAVTLVTGCASIPSSTTPQVINVDLDAGSLPENNDPRYEAITPQPGEPSVDVVNDFIAVSGSHEEQHAGARAYLTPEGNRAWKDSVGAVAIEDAGIRTFATKGGAEVVLRATKRGRVEEDGGYIPGPEGYSYTFQMKKIAGEWRIDNPPPGVIVTASTFERAWRALNVYFLDYTRTRVVPDVRLVPVPQTAALPSILVNMLGAGPSRALQGAVRSDLDGVRLQSNIIRRNDRVQVYFTGLDDSGDTLGLGGFAQLVWTLDQLGIGGVEVFADNQPIAPQGAPGQTLQRLNNWRSFNPDGLKLTTPGYFVRAGAIVTTANTVVPGPAGAGAYRARSVAVSTDLRSMAVVGEGPGSTAQLYVGPLGGTLKPLFTGRSLTPPTWGAADDEVWTVRNGTDVILVPTRGAPYPVTAPALNRYGGVWSLRLSRDGTRVALVVGPSGRQQLLLGVVIRENGATRIDQLRPVDVGDGPVSDVTWADKLTLVALVRARQQDSSLYTINIDGRTSGQYIVPSGLPGPLAAAAAGPSLPLLAVSAGGLWRSLGLGETWSRATREPTDSAPASAPAYPG